MQVIILPDGGALGQANGNTVIVSNTGDDLVEFSGNGNIFVYEQDGGHDVITSVNVDDGDQNELHFGPGITSADLTFYKEGDDLYISIADITGVEIGSITIVDWYLAEHYKLIIVFDDGTVLTPEEVEALVQSYVPLTGGMIQIGIEEWWYPWGKYLYGDGEEIVVSNLIANPILRFVPIPSNATINSIEWESELVPITYPNQIESPIEEFSYQGAWNDNSITVTVNGTFSMHVIVWEQR